MKEGVYHVSAHHDGWEDIRENVLNYDEEGGGEEDQVNNTHVSIVGEVCGQQQVWQHTRSSDRLRVMKRRSGTAAQQKRV